MADVFASFVTTEVALSAGVKKTVIQIANAANHRARVLGYHVSFDGTSGTAEPAVIEVLQQTSAGTMSSLTGAKNNQGDPEALQTTAQHTATAEPTGTTALKRHNVHPQGGYEWNAPFSREWKVGGATAGAQRLGIAITAPANVNVIAGFDIEE